MGIIVEKIKLAIVGCGAVAERCHLPSIKGIGSCEIEYLIDINEEKTKKLNKKESLRSKEPVKLETSEHSHHTNQQTANQHAMEAEATGPILNILSDYGREVGLSYQLADDLVDLENGEMIDSVIIPLLTRLENKTIDDNSLKIKTIRKKLEKNREKIKELYIEEIKRHVRKAEKLSKSEIIPPSPYRELLTQAPTYIINAMLKEINMTI